MKARKKFSLEWAFEPFQDDPSFLSKRMFGGLASYVHGRMVMLLCESTGDRQWKDKEFVFDIWNGILIPTEKNHHSVLKREFPSLIVHPVLSKWLYLPIAAHDFEESADKISRMIAKNDERLGVVPKLKIDKQKRCRKQSLKIR